MRSNKNPLADLNWRGNLLCFVFFQRSLPFFELYNWLRETGRRLLYVMTNIGFEMLEQAFFFWCTCKFCLLFRSMNHPHFRISLVHFFSQVLKKSSGHSRDILVVSSEMWRWAAYLTDGPREDFEKTIVCGKMTASFEAGSHEDRNFISYTLDYIKHFLFSALSTD